MMMIVLRLLSLLDLKSRIGPPNKPFFGGGGRGVAGFVDSGPKTLVPLASNRSTPPVDSRGLQWTPAIGDSTKSDFALARISPGPNSGSSEQPEPLQLVGHRPGHVAGVALG